MNNWVWHFFVGLAFIGLGGFLLFGEASTPAGDPEKELLCWAALAITYIGMIYAFISVSCVCPPPLLGRKPCS